MAKVQHLLVVVLLAAIGFYGGAVDAKMSKSMYINWGAQHTAFSNNGWNLPLVLDKTSSENCILECFGVQSKGAYLFGRLEMQMKLVANNSAGTFTTFYLSSTGDKHDEIDFELLGNVSGHPYIIHTNIHTQGNGSREVQFYRWFDPTVDFHNYTIFWNSAEVVWYVDGTPIRVFRNYQSQRIAYPTAQGMRAHTSLWNGDSWATRGGLEKIDWTSAPFVATLCNFRPIACTWKGISSITQCAAATNWYTSSVYSQLNGARLQRLNYIRDNYMIYNYCTDYKRFNGIMAPECSLPQY